jgi:hypothetical protein
VVDSGFEFRENSLIKYKDTDTYYVLINEEANLDEVFIISPQVNFKKEMVIIYAYMSSYFRPHEIKNIKLNDEVLEIEFTTKKENSNGSKTGIKPPPPQRRFFAIKMKKIDVTAVEFKKI